MEWYRSNVRHGSGVDGRSCRELCSLVRLRKYEASKQTDANPPPRAPLAVLLGRSVNWLVIEGLTDGGNCHQIGRAKIATGLGRPFQGA